MEDGLFLTKVLYSEETRKLFIAPYDFDSEMGWIVAFHYNIDLYTFTLIGTFEITDNTFTYFWTNGFKLSTEGDLFYVTRSNRSDYIFEIDQITFSSDYTAAYTDSL